MNQSEVIIKILNYRQIFNRNLNEQLSFKKFRYTGSIGAMNHNRIIKDFFGDAAIRKVLSVYDFTSSIAFLCKQYFRYQEHHLFQIR